MQTLIFEGIATSGKSTIIKELVKLLPSSSSIRIADEDETHVPIMEQREELHISFFENLIRKLVSNNPDLILIDRLYLTQAFRAKCDLGAYRSLERFLLQFNPTTIFLKIDEGAILERIQKATEHRETEWADYVKARGEKGQIADYYIDQQRDQLKLLSESLVPCKVFDTTKHDYQFVVEELISLVQN